MAGGAWWALVHGVSKTDTTEPLHFHFSLSCIGEGNGNPLQCPSLPGESQGRGSLVGCRLWGCTESATTEDLLAEGMATHSSILAWRIPWTIHGVPKNQT